MHHDEMTEDEETAVTYCRMLAPGYCSGRFNGSHDRDCGGGIEVPQSEYAWLMLGPWRSLAVEQERERQETEQAIRWHDARDCRNMNAYGIRDMDGGPFNYGRGR